MDVTAAVVFAVEALVVTATEPPVVADVVVTFVEPDVFECPVFDDMNRNAPMTTTTTTRVARTSIVFCMISSKSLM